MILEEQNLRSSLESRLRPNWHYDFAQLKICFFSPWYLNPQQRLVFVVFNQMRLFTIPPTDSSRCETRFKWELPTSRLHLKVLFPKHDIWVKSLWTGERIEFSLERGHNIIISISFQFFRQSLLNIRREKARIRCNKKIVIFLAIKLLIYHLTHLCKFYTKNLDFDGHWTWSLNIFFCRGAVFLLIIQYCTS